MTESGLNKKITFLCEITHIWGGSGWQGGGVGAV